MADPIPTHSPWEPSPLGRRWFAGRVFDGGEDQDFRLYDDRVDCEQRCVVLNALNPTETRAR